MYHWGGSTLEQYNEYDPSFAVKMCVCMHVYMCKSGMEGGVFILFKRVS